MRETTIAELRSHAKDYFDAVKGGVTVRVFRGGRPIAEIVPVRSGLPSWKRQATPVAIKGLSVSREILGDRDDGAWDRFSISRPWPPPIIISLRPPARRA